MAATAIFGLDTETVRSIVQFVGTFLVALVSGGAAYAIAIRNSNNARDLEREKRDFAASGQRRKLALLLAYTERSLKQTIDTHDQSPLAKTVPQLYTFVMTPELASAITDEATMLALYRVFETLETSQSSAAAFVAQQKGLLQDSIDEGETDLDADIWWPGSIGKMASFFLSPLEALGDYWRLSGDNARLVMNEVAIVDANKLVRTGDEAQKRVEALRIRIRLAEREQDNQLDG